VRRLSRRQFVQGAGLMAVSATALALLPAACQPSPAPVQPGPKSYRLGFLGDSPEPIFREAMQELGYFEGRNLTIVSRDAHDAADAATGAAQLVALPVDLLLATAQLQVRGARLATSVVPIVSMGYGGDLLAAGLVDNPARPGGNVTGVTGMATQLDATRLRLLKETIPSASRIATLGQEEPHRRADQSLGDAARALGVELHVAEIDSPSDLDRAFRIMNRQDVDALLVLGGSLTFTDRERIVDLAAQYGLPAIYDRREWVETGGLMVYQPNHQELQRRAAYYVDRILKGARPADLPVEQPMTFEFVVNMKTARELGLTFPNEIMLQVTEVINQ
jgi:putative ABC transport system substrate-binding protein